MEDYVSKYTGPEIDDALSRAVASSNQNLLDNSVFLPGCLVDQRGGYVVPPNTSCFGIDQTSGEWETDNYYTIESFYTYNGVEYGRFSANGGTYATNKTMCIRGYTGSGYTIDRWHSNGYNNQPVLIAEDGLVVYPSVGITQKIEMSIVGKTVTFSLLDTGNHLETFTFEYQSAFHDIPGQVYNLQFGDVIGGINLYMRADQTASRTVKAAKLELGSHQTLAHQDANGKWVLNELPNYADTLARCQRYGFPQHITYAYGYCVNDTLAYVCIPTPASLRETPVLTVNNPGFLNFVSQQISAQSLSVARIESSLMYIAVSASGLTPNAVCVLHDADIYISADL